MKSAYPEQLAEGGLAIRGGRLLCWRIGAPRLIRQRNQKAPERRGTWVFPWPYTAPGYAIFQFDAALPKNVRRAAWKGVWDAHARGELSDEELDAQLAALKANLERAMAGRGIRQLGPRRFWVEGQVFTRLGSKGEVLLDDFAAIHFANRRDPSGVPLPDRWALVTIEEFARRFRLYYAGRVAATRSEVRRYRCSAHIGWPKGVDTDYVELFLGRAAKIH
jgi:hypothetical protein